MAWMRNDLLTIHDREEEPRAFSFGLFFVFQALAEAA
jgi:hypothetical protein